MRKIAILLISLLFIACTVKAESMAIEFDIDRHDYIRHQNWSVDKPGLEQFSVCAWIYPNHLASAQTYSAFNSLNIYNGDTYITNYYLFLIHQNTVEQGTGLIYFESYKWQPEGSWYVDNAIKMDTWNHICVTYDASSINNNPLIYWNGISQSVVETDAPGTERTYTRYGNVKISSSDTTMNFDGLIQDVRVYNRILSAQEIETLYNSRALKVVQNGLVFWAPMWGTNAESFDGLTLNSTHRIIDWISGAVGTPTGSPIGRANTIQAEQ